MYRLTTLLLAAMSATGPVAAQAPADPAAAFGAREYVQQISLSPDGKKVAMIVPGPGQSSKLLIGDLVAGGEPRMITRASGDPDKLDRCDWASAERLICTIRMRANLDGRSIMFSRLIALNSDGSEVKMVSMSNNNRSLGLAQWGGGLIDWGSDDGSGNALLDRVFVPENTTGTHTAKSRKGLGVEMVNTRTLERKVVEAPRGDAVNYISDGHGTVRIMGLRPLNPGGYDGPVISYYYRKPEGRDWLKLSDLVVDPLASSGFTPSIVDRDANVVYGYDRVDGRRALFKIALDGSLKRELVFARPDVDVSGLITVGRHNRVVGADYVTDRRLGEFFDPALVKLRASLGKALPRQPLVRFLDASSDESRLLMFAGSDVDPGRYYVFDKGTRKLEEVMSVRPELDKMKLATVQSVTFPAADGTQIPGYLTLPVGSTGKGLPALVMPHGGPGARDEWGFDWLSQYFAARGFAVLQPNFRGSTGYGDDWFQKNGFQSWRTAIGDVNDGGKWLIAQGIADPAKLGIFGWSYGGYAALQSPALDPNLFKAIVAVAPVTDLDALRAEARDFMNFVQVDKFIGRGEHVRDGSPARNAAGIKAPVLLFHGTLDRNVGVGESRLMAKRLTEAGRKVDYVEFEGLDHYLDDSAARTKMLGQSDAFLRSAMGIAAQ